MHVRVGLIGWYLNVIGTVHIPSVPLGNGNILTETVLLLGTPKYPDSYIFYLREGRVGHLLTVFKTILVEF